MLSKRDRRREVLEKNLKQRKRTHLAKDNIGGK